MKALFNTFCFLLILSLSLVSCDSDDDKLTAEEIAYIERNEAYLEEKAAEKDAEGNPVYQQVEYAGYTVLYRVLEKEGDDTSAIELDTEVTMKLKGDYISGQTFQQEMEMTYRPEQLIVGLALVLLEAHKGEKIETIIPAVLGYGYDDRNGIVKGSTLVFTFTVLDVK